MGRTGILILSTVLFAGAGALGAFSSTGVSTATLRTPYSDVQGEYNGLIAPTNPVTHEHVGAFSLKLSRRGEVTGGRVTVQGRSWSVFDAWFGIDSREDGRIEIDFWQGDVYDGTFHQVMTMQLQFDLTNGTDQVRGTVSDARLQSIHGKWVEVPATWVATLQGDRNIFNARTNPAPQAGVYTMVFPGGHGTGEPSGAGFAGVSIDATGHVRMTGLLADGTIIAQNTSLSKDGHWPLFVKLYGGQGSLLGWLSVPAPPESSIGGAVIWARPANASDPAYRAGFTNALETVGSHYYRPASNQRLNFTNGLAVFSGADLPSPWTNTFRLESNGRARNVGTNRFDLTIKLASGLFNGTFKHPVSGKSTNFKGALLQDQTVGFGFFLTTKRQAGSVVLLAAPD